jgi:hypothetical protein
MSGRLWPSPKNTSASNAPRQCVSFYSFAVCTGSADNVTPLFVSEK